MLVCWCGEGEREATGASAATKQGRKRRQIGVCGGINAHEGESGVVWGRGTLALGTGKTPKGDKWHAKGREGRRAGKRSDRNR